LTSGSIAEILWEDLAGETIYEWYAVVDDGIVTVQSETWPLTTLDEPAENVPAFNIWSILITFCLLIISGILFKKKEKHLSDI
jgi:hypothetical protein